MTGLQQLMAWLFGTSFAAVTACSVVKSWATGRVEVAQHEAQATVEAARAHADAYVRVHQAAVEAQHGSVFPPADWLSKGGDQ